MLELVETMAEMTLAYLNGKHKLSDRLKKALSGIKNVLDSLDLS